MNVRIVRRTFTPHREVILAATFVAMASYELLELVWLSASLPLHAIQVMIILAATWVVLRADISTEQLGMTFLLINSSDLPVC